MTRKLWLLLILIVLLVAWWSYRQLDQGMRMGDVIAYNVLFYTVAMEVALWSFVYWWRQHDPRERELVIMRATLAELRRTKHKPKQVQEKGF